MIFQGNNIFRNNSASIGAGIQLVRGSSISLNRYAHILFKDNHAEYVGGAIYIVHSQGRCYIDTESPDNVVINFVGNTAGFGGSSLYNAGVENCLCCQSAILKKIPDIVNTSNSETEPSAIATDPYDVRMRNSSQTVSARLALFMPTQARIFLFALLLLELVLIVLVLVLCLGLFVLTSDLITPLLDLFKALRSVTSLTVKTYSTQSTQRSELSNLK